MTPEQYAEWERQDREEGPAVWAEILEQIKRGRNNESSSKNTK